MPQHMKTLLRDKIFLVAIAITIGILYLSLVKIPKSNININHLDKLQHGFAYFILSISWLFTFYKKNSRYLIVCCCILFGILIEILQNELTNYRTGDYLDGIANSMGVIIGLLIFNLISKKMRLKNKKICN
jgi:VanZ family protein